MILGIAGAITALSIVLSMRLQLLTGFDSLLPQTRPSVVELHRVAERTSSLSTIFVVLEGSERDGLRKAGDMLVTELKKLGPPWVGQIEDGVQDQVKFLEPRGGLFAKLDALQSLDKDLEAQFTYEINKQSGLLFDDTPPPKVDAAEVKRRLGIDAMADTAKKWPDGYYQSQDGKTLIVAIRCGVLGADFPKAAEALRRVKEVVDQSNIKQFDPTLRAGYTGDLAIGLGEYSSLRRDLTSVGLFGAVLVLGAIFLYYLRIRPIVAMFLTILVGLSWTFGFTALALGHLNLATGFLFTIIGGNGINFGILFMARYLDERHRHKDVNAALHAAVQGTWTPTLTAAATASASYGALIVTEFKGFKEFGIIGGVGMIICWVATYFVLPSIVIVSERLWPSDAKLPGLLGRIAAATEAGLPFGAPFAWLVERAPRFIVITGVLSATAFGVIAYNYARHDPMEYDLNNIQSSHVGRDEEVHRLFALAIHITEYVGLDGMAIVTDRIDQVKPLKAALLARRDAAPADAKPFKDVVTLLDFVPEDQAEKIPVLQRLRRRLMHGRDEKIISDADWASVSPYLPPADLQAFGLNDLPPGLAQSFTERDGTRGRILYISPISGDLTADAHYLFRWADSFRRTDLPDGSTIYGSGRAVIFADVWDAVLGDVPKAVAVSFLATLLIVLIAFRGRSASLAVFFGLAVGVSWMAGTLALVHLKLNFLNFIALPITFGIGVDYAVNIVLRDLELKNPTEVLRRTGGAVVLCSLTTLLGYFALVRSVNIGVRSMGTAAVGGEIACVLAAVLVLPSAMLLWHRRRGDLQRKAGEAGEQS